MRRAFADLGLRFNNKRVQRWSQRGTGCPGLRRSGSPSLHGRIDSISVSASEFGFAGLTREDELAGLTEGNSQQTQIQLACKLELNFVVLKDTADAVEQLAILKLDRYL